MNVLIVGSGAREHALAWKLRQSPRLTDLFVAPGNPGTAAIAQNLPLAVMDFDAIARACVEHRIELVVVGPEDPLAGGLVDFLAERGIPAYGPTRAAAQIEASKAFAKELMRRAGIPTAEARAFDDADGAIAFAESWTDRTGLPPVVKADGLAAGKGVTVAVDVEDARRAIHAALVDGSFGASGSRIVLEERMTGPEASAQAFTDGVTVIPMAYSCDYKRALDGDQGPNTGGMGAYSPPGFIDDVLAESIFHTIIRPTVEALAAAGTPYRGTLYPGLMITDAGPRVVEYNCRFGDPETQVLMPRLESDLLEIMLAVVEGRLAGTEIQWSDQPAVGIVLASGNYPGDYEIGLPIEGLDAIDEDVQVFHAGTRLADGALVTAGGRVLTVVARGGTLAEARERVYDNVARIRYEGIRYRHDIALRELEPSQDNRR
ncbi:MAG: phosphoribosylamine--glycine ligase [Dehalococcoidia bacterium]